jgi:hypothetical protein
MDNRSAAKLAIVNLANLANPCHPLQQISSREKSFSALSSRDRAQSIGFAILRIKAGGGGTSV